MESIAKIFLIKSSMYFVNYIIFLLIFFHIWSFYSACILKAKLIVLKDQSQNVEYKNISSEVNKF